MESRTISPAMFRRCPARPRPSPRRTRGPPPARRCATCASACHTVSRPSCPRREVSQLRRSGSGLACGFQQRATLARIGGRTSELAIDRDGEPFDMPSRAAGWQVRRIPPRGTPQIVYSPEGVPLILPITAGLEDLRRAAGSEGRYQLALVDERRRRMHSFLGAPGRGATCPTPPSCSRSRARASSRQRRSWRWRRIRVRFDGVAPRVQLVALGVVDAGAADPRLAIVVFLRRWRCPLVRLGSRRRAGRGWIGWLAHPDRHSIQPGAHRRDVGRDKLGLTGNLLEICNLVGDLDADLRGALREERATGGHKARGAERPLDAPVFQLGLCGPDGPRMSRVPLVKSLSDRGCFAVGSVGRDGSRKVGEGGGGEDRHGCQSHAL
jgi:hypothetical protein